MKKIKILPSILMLVACVAVLGVGVYAVAPTQNTINGTITVQASNTPVGLEVIKGTETIATYDSVRSGQQIDFGTLKFFEDGDPQNTIYDANEIRLTIKVTNKGEGTVGAFFANSTTSFNDGELADLNDFIVKKEYKEESKKISTGYFTAYTPISASQTEEMAISLILNDFPTTNQNFDLGITLFIEPYVATATEDVEDSDFVKIADGTTSLSAYDYDSKWLAVPRSVTYIQEVLYLRGLNYPNNNQIMIDPCWDYKPGFIPANCDDSISFEIPTDHGALFVFVSYENETYSNDIVGNIYNKDKTKLIYINNGSYIAPSVVLLNNRGITCGNGDVTFFDFSKCINLTSIDLGYLQSCYLTSYTMILPANLQAIEGGALAAEMYEDAILNYKFTGKIPPTFAKLILDNYYGDVTVNITVPKGCVEAYTEAISVNNLTALNEGYISITD